MLPLGLIEASHFLSSVAGASLLLLSQGLTRRLDAAHALAFAVLAFATVASVLKGAGWIEVALLAALLLVLWRAKPAFDRRAALFDTPLSVYWAASVIAALSTSIWLGLFAYKHVEVSNQLWWRFEVYGDASRFLRASVGAAMLVLLFTVSRLLRHAPPETSEPTDADLADAARAIAAQTSTFPNLVYLRDKALLFNEQRTAFVMYAVQGRTWVALGDPVGPPECHAYLIRSFLERCDDYGGIPVFYEVRKDYLHHYADFGLTVVKLGEEAVVDSSTFTLEGGHAGKLRQMRHRFEREGGRFRVVPAADVPECLGELREVSDEWLKGRPGGEKGFSLGYFDPAYLSRFPVAVIEGQGRILAFASLLPGPNGVELSSDLMRHRHDAPKAVMEILFAHLLEWGKEHGYRRFTLGMAPLSGVETSPVAPLWNRLGAFLYEHGEKIYRFQGLRAFKDKFGPAWEPRYLAYVGGMRLPRHPGGCLRAHRGRLSEDLPRVITGASQKAYGSRLTPYALRFTTGGLRIRERPGSQVARSHDRKIARSQDGKMRHPITPYAASPQQSVIMGLTRRQWPCPTPPRSPTSPDSNGPELESLLRDRGIEPTAPARSSAGCSSAA